MKTVIGIDGWTAGSRHFERLVSAFEARGYRLLLIHIGSWGHEKNRPSEEMIGNLRVRDIAFYKEKTVPEILDLEKPSAILFLSTRSFAHMAFNRYALYKKIPTCHLYHGLVAVQAVGIGEKTYKVNYAQYAAMLIRRLKKNLFILIPFYAKSLYNTSAPFNNWVGFLKEVIRKATGLHGTSGISPPDIKTTIGCVYTAADVEHMHRTYQVSLDNIHVVGNPDLIHFGLAREDVAFALRRTKESGNLIYIATGLSEVGLVFNSREDFVHHILQARDYLMSIGLGLIVKLHPAQLKHDTPKMLVDHGITLCSNEDFIERLKTAKAVIVEPSSAAMIPALIGLPILLCQYGKLSGQLYGEVLTTYPRSRYLKNLSDTEDVLDEEQQTLSVDAVQAWIEKNAGPLPAEEMPNRVVHAIHEMVQSLEQHLSRQ